MLKNKLLLICFLCPVSILFSQTSINGKVIVKGQSAEGIHVLNLVSEKATVTNQNGEFSIVVKEDDLLVFSAVHLNYWRKSISERELKNGFVEVEMTTKEINLDEVELTEYTKINAQELGIINYQPKAYTPAERKLRPTQIKQIDVINFNSVTIPLDPLLYWITGKTKKLKKELEIEQKELLLDKLNDWNSNEYYIKELKIPEIYLDGFKLFVVYDEEMINFLRANHKNQGNFRITKLAEAFLTNLKPNE